MRKRIKIGEVYASKTPEYWIWDGMKRRCYSTHNKRYKNYGGRGIKVCTKWQKSFLSFYQDMGQRPSLHHSLERINNNGDYSPENCKWATDFEQALNRRLKPNKLGFTGVNLHIKPNGHKMWQPRVQVQNKRLSFGYYSSPEEAAYVRDQFVLQLHGDNSATNFNYDRL